MLDPQLCTSSREECFNRLSRDERLRLIEIEGGYTLERAGLWKMIEIAGQHDASGLTAVSRTAPDGQACARPPA